MHTMKHLSLWGLNQMIVSSFEIENRQANVCRQGREWVVMCYENSQFIKDLIALREDDAELLADKWLHHEPV